MARATTTKAPKPAAKASQAQAGDQKTVEGIFVRSFPPTFRRAGFAFTSEGMGIALDAISAEQLQALQDEPMLSVEFCDFPVDDAVAEASEQTSAE